MCNSLLHLGFYPTHPPPRERLSCSWIIPGYQRLSCIHAYCCILFAIASEGRQLNNNPLGRPSNCFCIALIQVDHHTQDFGAQHSSSSLAVLTLQASQKIELYFHMVNNQWLALCLVLEIKEFRHYDAKIEESEKASSHQELNTGHLATTNPHNPLYM